MIRDGRQGAAWRAMALFLIAANKSKDARGSEEYREGFEAGLVALLRRFEALERRAEDGRQLAAVVDELLGAK